VGCDAGGGLLDALVRQAAVPEYQYRLQWRPGTFVVFDNQALQHYAANDYLPARRVMGRVTVGEWHPDLMPAPVASPG
jgi:taurine dioxygenase